MSHTQKHCLPKTGDNTVNHQREDILCSQWVMKLWQRSSREAERLTVSLQSPENQWPVEHSAPSDWEVGNRVGVGRFTAQPL